MRLQLGGDEFVETAQLTPTRAELGGAELRAINRIGRQLGRGSRGPRRLGLASVQGHLAGAGATTTIIVLDVADDTAVRLRDQLTVAASRG